MNQKNVSKGKNKIKYLSAILIFATIINIGSLSVAHAAVSSGSIVSLTNSSRAQAGLSLLSTNGQLASAATAKANDMFTNQYFAHTSPDGKAPWNFINESGYTYTYAGENLAIGYSDASELQAAWMNSPSHRENILSPNFSEIGVASISGVFEGADTIIVVEMFGSQSETPAPVPAKVEAATDNTVTPQEVTTQPVTSEQNSSMGINLEKTSFSPDKIFVNDEVTFKTLITGELSDAYFKVGEQKIDFKDVLMAQKDQNEKNLEKKAKIDKTGDLTITLVVIDKSGKQQVTEIGKLSVLPTVITNNSAVGSTSIWQKTVNQLSDNILTLSSIMIVLTLGFVSYLVFRYQKFGKLI